MNFKLAFTYEYCGKTIQRTMSSDENFELKFENKDNQVKVILNAKNEIKVKKFALRIPYKFYNNERIFVNGYQSWTDSREYTPYEKMDGLDRITDFVINLPLLDSTGLNRAGDETFYNFPHKNGVFYGFSYGYVRQGDKINLFGSLDEHSGYTIIEFNTNNDCVYVKKDLEGVTFKGESELLNLAALSGEYESTFDKYFEMMGVKSRCDKRLSGYTTWYNYYSGVTEEIVRRDLDALSALDKKVDIFQIDDGYQAAIGDWLITDSKKFPSGMKAVADEIHSKDMLAGLWLAPFAGTKNSKLFNEHPDWFIKDEKGKPYLTGPNWGTFYSLDIYNEDARAYIHHFFDVVLNEWGYDLVKLDFLYGACVLPMYNKTRGEVMCDAMDLLRECCVDKYILGCGVPLMPAFGKVDFCRIGADIHLEWKPRSYTHREDVSTPHAINNAIFRRHLDGRAFMNDPDVFLLRENNIQMNFEQRKLLAKINSLFGNVLFVSDNVSDYNEKQLKAFLDTAFSNRATILSAAYKDERNIEIEYILDGQHSKLIFDAYDGTTIGDFVVNE